MMKNIFPDDIYFFIVLIISLKRRIDYA